MTNTPPGATHYSFFYGTKTFYRKMEMKYLNQVSEEWETRDKYYEYDSRAQRWVAVGNDFSNRKLKEL